MTARHALPALILLFACSTSALAHPGHDAGAGFVAGFAHAYSGLDHLLALLAVGLYAGSRRGAQHRAMLPGFVAALLAGAALGIGGLSVWLLEPLLAATVLILGLGLALRAGATAAGVLLAGLFALLHGLAHGTEIPAAVSGLYYLAGMAVTSTLLLATGVAAGQWQRTMARWSGVPIAMAGGWLLLHALG